MKCFTLIIAIPPADTSEASASSRTLDDKKIVKFAYEAAFPKESRSYKSMRMSFRTGPDRMTHHDWGPAIHLRKTCAADGSAIDFAVGRGVPTGRNVEHGANHAIRRDRDRSAARDDRRFL